MTYYEKTLAKLESLKKGLISERDGIPFNTPEIRENYSSQIDALEKAKLCLKETGGAFFRRICVIQKQKEETERYAPPQLFDTIEK